MEVEVLNHDYKIVELRKGELRLACNCCGYNAWHTLPRGGRQFLQRQGDEYRFVPKKAQEGTA